MDHPMLDIGPLRIPGPTLPVILVILPLAAKLLPLHLAHRYHTSTLLGVFHSLTFLWNTWSIIIKTSNQKGPNLILLQFIALILGEASLQESDLRPYTWTALGWILLYPGPDGSFPDDLPRSTVRGIRSLMLSIPCAMQVGGRVSLGAMLSGTSLFSIASLRVIESYGLVQRYSGVVAIISSMCSVALVRQVRKVDWFISWLEVSWFGDCARHIREYDAAIRCGEVAVFAISTKGVSWIISSFIWSCFPWRRLFSAQLSRAPEVSIFSLAGASILLLPAMFIVNLGRRRPANGHITILARHEVGSCLHEVWWTSLLCLGLWLLCELASGGILSTCM